MDDANTFVRPTIVDSSGNNITNINNINNNVA